MWPFSSEKTSVKESQVRILEIKKQTEELAKSFVNAEIKEYDLIAHADDVYSKAFRILEQGEKDIQQIFEDAEEGKLEEERFGSLTRELTILEHMRAEIVSVTDGVIKTASIALKIENAIRETAQKSLSSAQLKKLKLLDEAERKILDDAKDMSKMAYKINSTIKEILTIDPDEFKLEMKIQAQKLRRKKSAIDVALLKLKSDIREIDSLKRDVLQSYNVGKELGLQFNLLESEINYLSKGAPYYIGGKN